MIPGWKVRRELGRLREQLRAIPEAIWEPVYYGRYSRRFPADLCVHDGGCPVGQSSDIAHVALVLIYPVPGLPASTVSLLDGLVAEGFAPLVISNAPLGSNLERILTRAWKLVERPNIGHDFGGYRDGIHLLWRWGVMPDELLIMNDSVWLVDDDPSALLTALRATGADVAGSVMRRRGNESFLESYCYLISRNVLRSDAFQNYWRNYRPTSNKYKVIRRGERGHSAALLRGGFELRAAYDDSVFFDLLSNAGNDLIRDAIAYGAYAMPGDRKAALALAEKAFVSDEGADWREGALAFIRDSLRRGQYYSQFPVAARRLLAYPFLKRSGDLVARRWRRAWLEAVRGGALDWPAGPVAAELRERVDRDAPLGAG